MDFEVLEFEETESNLFTEIAEFFRNRRRQLQDWDSNPPHRLGWWILLAVSLELTLSMRLSKDLGLGRDIVGQTFSIAVLFLLGELALAKVGQEVGEFFKKKGQILTTVTFFNISLMPLLLILPLTLLNRFIPHVELVVLLGTIILASKVLSNFRESLEISFEFSKLQSALVLYASGGLISVAIVVVVYISFFGLLTEFFRSF